MGGFTTILSTQRHRHAEITSLFREISDGHFHETFGTGVEVKGSGTMGPVVAVTDAIDAHYAVLSAIGERFVRTGHRLGPSRPDSAAGRRRGSLPGRLVGFT